MTNFLESKDFELLELLLEEEGINRKEDRFFIPRRGLTKAPTSFQQRRLWFLHELHPSSSAYNICSVFRLDGLLQLEAIAGYINDLATQLESEMLN